MSKTYISKALRLKVTDEARGRCGYCQTNAAITGTPMDVEHIIPEALGGLTTHENLWLACSLCNGHKGTKINAQDPLTEQRVPLFQPRQQSWNEHFQWSDKGTHIIGLTPTGRATIEALALNRSDLIKARQIWASVGWHPPVN